ncbi:hypothetical protein CSC81_12105 [Tenacibaculum discolor]|uniref:Uncharacterized protein n=1 Tax=Tenacibaculum discolor TaxID=361581 RepID=A0A2G1BTQ0_9FLAO|nr:hypothetical protein [Tenacibaculum discolor]MDP2542474.1 hypothetical protein [Tenacibaculum discolor]PHN97209.1 hypothetical protein CSC81_12105 [Tenacibaculum discolor]PHO00645.1 hypothetical protein CSC82_27775 [Rhodobacteraceae bacterium 4F10]
MEVHLKIIGYLLILLALIHAIFPKYFKWKDELKGLSLMNKQMMMVHTFFIALTVFLMGSILVLESKELIETNLGRKIILGFAVFWSIRLFIQLFVYSPELWRGKKIETAIHVFFTCFWVYISAVTWNIWFN